MVDKVVILDIDETLLYSRQAVEGSILFDYGGDECYKVNELCPTKARPSARMFLRKLEIREYIIAFLTQGVVPFQIAALEALDLYQYFDVGCEWGWRSVRRDGVFLPEGFLDGKKWIMVDNLPADSYVREKAEWLGLRHFTEGVNYLQVVDYYGTDSDPQDLTELLPTIEDMLR